ncbi:MAG: hypothetical protein C0467_05610 [Planctomycetaceae bacterium]|nr:hypothetical protein [Planctomycetaceae bacterium]
MNPNDLTTGPDPNAQPWQKQPQDAGAPTSDGGVGSLADAASGAIDIAGGALDAAGTVIEGAGGCLDGCSGCSAAILIALFLTAGTAFAMFN